MPTDTELKQLVINELTEEQYKGLTPNEDELYLTPDPMTTNTDGSVTLNQGLTVSTNGNVEVGKNLEVDGTIKMNGGFEDIHEYEIDNNHSLHIIAEKGTYFLGGVEEYESKDSEYRTYDYPLAIGYYSLNEGKVVNIAYLTFPDPQDGSVISHYIDLGSGELVERTISSGNIDLYRHEITVTAGSYRANIIFQSSSNLVCDSVQDLRTLLLPSGNHTAIPTVYSKQTGVETFEANPGYLVITQSTCSINYVPAPLGVVSNVTSVSDTVTTI